MIKKTHFSILPAALALWSLPLVNASASWLSGIEYGERVDYLVLINNVVTAIWWIFCGVVVVCFILAGIMFMTAQGEPEKLKTARAAFVWGVVGVAVAIIAYSIIKIVGGALGL